MNLSTFLQTFALIFIAEMGDKTQIVSMILATRFDWKRAFAGIALAFALINLFAVFVGQILFNWIELGWIRLGAGALFIFFGFTTLRSRKKSDTDDEVKASDARGPFLTAFLMIFLAEMGDKTQLMTATLAAQHVDYLSVFAGSTLALWLVSFLGMALGVLLVRKVPIPLIKGIAGIVFIAFGLASLAQGATLMGWIPCFEKLKSIIC